MEWEPQTSAAAAIVSAIAAWIAAWQAWRTYKLALQQDRRLHPFLELYLVSGHIRRLGTPSERVFVFRLMITNKSDAGNAVKDLHLIIHHSGKQGIPGHITIPHNPDLAALALPENQEKPFRIPCAISARTVIGGVGIFGVPEELIRDFRIESYTVTAVDSFGNFAEREAILLQEV